MRIFSLFFTAVFLVMVFTCGNLHAAGIKVVPSATSVVPGSDFYFDVVAEGIPAEGLEAAQFRLNLNAPGSSVTGVSDLGQTKATDISIASPLVTSPSTASRSGIGDYFWNGRGSNGILLIDNDPMAAGTGLFTFAHTNGAVKPVGNGSLARFVVKAGSSTPAAKLDITLSNARLMGESAEFPLDYNIGASVQFRCIATVPSLAGLTLSAAQSALSAANLTLGTTYEVSNPGGLLPMNVVLDQSSPSGTQLECNSRINLAINIPPLGSIDPGNRIAAKGAITLTGTMEEGALVTLTAGNNATIGTVVSKSPTTWECVVSGLAAGETTVTATFADRAGNKASCFATVTNNDGIVLAVSQAGISSDYKGLVTLSVSNLAATGIAVNFEQLVDSNRNGLVDPGDYVIRSFKVTDGVAQANPSVPGDSDGIVNGAIAVNLPYFLNNDVYHAPGQYIFRVTNGTYTATALFAVTPLTRAQSISGTVTASSAPVPGAIVQLTDKWNRPVSYVVAGETGQYALNVKDAGDYLVVPLSYGYSSGSPTPVSIASGQNLAGRDLTLVPGLFNVTGRVKDDKTDEGVDGVWVRASGSSASGIAISGSGGAYRMLLPAGQYTVSAAADPTVPNTAAKGYLAFDKPSGSINVNADVTGTDIALPRADILVSGKVLNGQGGSSAGIPVQGAMPESSDSRIPVGYGVTNDFGDYTLALNAADNWRIFLNDPSAQILGYIGSIIPDYSTTTGPLNGNNLTAYPIRSWVRGTVRDSANNLVAGADVQLRNPDSSIVASLKTASDGTYMIGAFAGEWLVDLLTHNKLNQVLEQSVTLNDSQTATVDFVIDVTPPALVISPVTTPATSNTQTINGTVEAGSTITVSVNTSASVGPVTYPTPSTWNCTVSGLAAGNNIITATASDMAGNTSSTTATIQMLTDISSQVSVTTTGFLYGRVTKLYTGNMMIKNISQNNIAGPLFVLLTNLTPGVVLTNASGYSNGIPYINSTISQGLTPGSTLTIPLQFSDPTNVKINFATVTYQ